MMSKKKIILIGAVSFLLIVFFSPRQVEIYYQEIDSDGHSSYYIVPRIIFSIFNYFLDERFFYNTSSILPDFIDQKQLLKEASELTHEERFDILNNSTCEYVIYNTLSPCVARVITQACYSYYQSERYSYCKSIYDETSISDEECKILQYEYLEFWTKQLGTRPGDYSDYDLFEEDHCNAQMSPAVRSPKMLLSTQ